MSHNPEVRLAARSAYVYQRLPMEQVAAQLRVATSTLRRWREAAREAGDDWETARAAASLSQHANADVARRVIEDFLLMHESISESIKSEHTLSAIAKAKALASLADSYHKTMAAFRRAAPTVNRYSVALDVLNDLAEFVKVDAPHAADILLAVLPDFAQRVAKRYGKANG
ncbi:DUF1804 family protein [Pandoraea fibrosis]|uniref:DNA-binding protein n=1 Tax=Pandoraea fibrosis TaxID=1891094 RepID=A0A5E4XGF1_9BURK|nr:DUF1804 family protein [Pandoraea fibrosis]VVE35383.1 DNA-binding protein [Pandoraea fibrosis]